MGGWLPSLTFALGKPAEHEIPIKVYSWICFLALPERLHRAAGDNDKRVFQPEEIP
jgi:hypothetical protein